ncbi:hypothetical protein OpiT1DRAFT_04755 [Opitutaceae bacterium TAV1]|nr:hypothetical protein OpiT1DRAFT_04755 [Opitutaceae bacterium TAV1]
MGSEEGQEAGGKVPFPALAAAVVILIFCVVALLSGCSNGRHKVTPPAATATAGSVLVSQTGDAARPATASADTAAAKLPIPAGSDITFTQRGEVLVKLAAESILSLDTRRESATGPQAFTPPLPPSPADEAAGWRVKAYTWAALACIVLAGLFAWRAHWLAAICAGIAAAACHLLSSPAGLYAAGTLLVAAVVFVIAWHITQKQKAVSL